MEGEDLAGAGLRVALIGEAGEDAGGLVEEGERDVVTPGLHEVFEAAGIAGGLDLDAAEGHAFGFGFDETQGFAVDEEQVVGEAGFEGGFTHGDAGGGGVEVDLIRSLWMVQPAAISSWSIPWRASCSGRHHGS